MTPRQDPSGLPRNGGTERNAAARSRSRLRLPARAHQEKASSAPAVLVGAASPCPVVELDSGAATRGRLLTEVALDVTIDGKTRAIRSHLEAIRHGRNGMSGARASTARLSSGGAP